MLLRRPCTPHCCCLQVNFEVNEEVLERIRQSGQEAKLITYQFRQRHQWAKAKEMLVGSQQQTQRDVGHPTLLNQQQRKRCEDEIAYLQTSYRKAIQNYLDKVRCCSLLARTAR